MPKQPLLWNQLQSRQAEVFVYGYIGDEVTAADIAKTIQDLELDNDTIVFRINSGGGSIFEGIAIFNTIRLCRCQTVARIDGLAASMGSVIPLACGRVEMSKNGMMMTHRAGGWTGGSADTMRNYAKLMESMETVMCNIYAARTGLTCEQARAKYLQADDRWINAEQALEEKLIDSIYDVESAFIPDAQMRDDKKLIASYNSSFNFQNSNNDMHKIELTAAQASLLGLTATATPAQSQVVVDNLIAKAGQVDQMQMKLTAAEKKAFDAEAKLTDISTAASTEKVTAMITAATGKKITAETAKQMQADYAGKPEELSKLLNSLPDFGHSITSQIAANALTGGGDKFKDKTWAQLDKAGLLEELKAQNFDRFKALFASEFKTEYKG